MTGMTTVQGVARHMWVEAQGHAFNGKFRQLTATDRFAWAGCPQGALICEGNLGIYFWVAQADLLVLHQYEVEDAAGFTSCSFSNGELRDMPEWVHG